MPFCRLSVAPRWVQNCVKWLLVKCICRHLIVFLPLRAEKLMCVTVCSSVTEPNQPEHVCLKNQAPGCNFIFCNYIFFLWQFFMYYLNYFSSGIYSGFLNNTLLWGFWENANQAFSQHAVASFHSQIQFWKQMSSDPSRVITVTVKG